MDPEAQLAGFIARFSPLSRALGLSSPQDLDRPDVAALVDAALGLARVPMEASSGAELIIKSVSAKQRPRR